MRRLRASFESTRTLYQKVTLMSSVKNYKEYRFSGEELKGIGERFHKAVIKKYVGHKNFMLEYGVNPNTYKKWRYGKNINIPLIIRFCKDHPETNLNHILTGK